MKRITFLLLALLFIGCSVSEIEKDDVPQIAGPQGIPGIGVPGENGLALWYRFTNENQTCYVLFQYHEDGEESGYQEYEDREELESPEVCAITGNNGFNSLIRVETIEPGNDCEHGGKWILIGLDTNRNNILEDSEINQRIKWCIEKCPHECVDVYDTEHCTNGSVYVMWIDGIYYYNEDLTLRQFDDDTARLYGKVTKHNSTKTYLIDVTFSEIVNVPVKDHSCLTVDSSGWIQYSKIEGTMKDVDGSPIYNISIRPGTEPFQVGVGANAQSSENVLSASGWFITDGHGKCEGDFNFNICRESSGKSNFWDPIKI